MYVTCNVDVDMLDIQISDILESNIRETSKDCLHHLLGEIKDNAEDRPFDDVPILSLNKEFLYRIFKDDPKRVEQIRNMSSKEMITVASMVSHRLAQLHCENIKKQVRHLFEYYYTFPYEEEAKTAADSLDYLLDKGPLNGDDIEKLVEQFKLELQDRHGDLGEETDTPQPSTNPGNEMRHKQSKHGCDIGKVDIMSRRDDVG